MKIKKIVIKNFCSIAEETVECDNRTIFIGANGAGKSTVLKALSIFFDSSFRPSRNDFFAHALDAPIEITVTFSNFSKQTADEFKDRIHGDELVITRVWSNVNEQSTYQSLFLANPDFQGVRTATTATQKKQAYSRLTEYKLPAWSNQGAAEEALTEWESKNPRKCCLMKDGGQFFGQRNIGSGKLQNAANFIFIEAVKDVTDHADGQKNSAVSQLMDLIVRASMLQNNRIKEYQDKINLEYAALSHPSKFPQLNSLEGALSKSLQTYYQDVGVKLDWKKGLGIALPPPQAEVMFKEEDFEFPVERAGNGMQRAFIISLLHQLCVVKFNSTEAVNDNQNDTTVVTPLFLENLPSVILAIEEPELYQHPTKQWHFAQVLRKLSSGEVAIFGDVQILFCTHSPHFIDLEDFDKTRIATKERMIGKTVKSTKIRKACFANVVKALETAHGARAGSYDPIRTRDNLHTFGTELSEGFFANAIVLVEGVSDKAALDTVACAIGFNFVEDNIAIIPVGGKNNLDKSFSIFNELNIPTYCIWDTDDGDSTSGNIKTNRSLQRMLGVKEAEIVDFPAIVGATFACFKTNLNAELEGELTQAFSKNPFTMRKVLQQLYAERRRSTALESIVKAIYSFAMPMADHPEAKEDGADQAA